MKLVPSFLKNEIANRPNLLKILDNIGWLFFDKAIRFSVALLVGVWVARYLGPEQFGILSYALSFAAIFSIFADLGLKGILVRNLVNKPEDRDTLLGTAFVLQVIGALFAIALLNMTILLLRPNDNLTRIIVSVLGFSLVFRSSQVIRCWFESQVQLKYVVWVENVIILFIAAIKVALIIQKAALITFAIVNAVEVALVLLGLACIYIKKSHSFARWKIKIDTGKQLLKDSWPMILSGASVLLYMKIDQIMIGELMSQKEVGIYSAAVRISEIWYFFPIAINTSIGPMLYRLRETNRQLYHSRLGKALKLMIWMSVFIAIAFHFLSESLIGVLYGHQYLDSAAILKIHIWAGIFVAVNNTSWNWYFAENRQNIAVLRVVIGLFINVLLNYALIPKHGGIGAAWATLITRSFVGYFGHLINKKTRPVFWIITRSIIKNPVR